MLSKKLRVEENSLPFHVLIFLPSIKGLTHDELLEVLNELIDFSFKGGNGEFISVDSHDTKWAKEKRLGLLVLLKAL